MKYLVEKTGGCLAQVNPDEQVGWRGFELSTTLNTPRLLGVTVADTADRVAFLPFDRAASQGEEIAAVCRVKASEDLPAEVVVRGTLEGRPFEKTLNVGKAVEAGHLPRTWASLEIEKLLNANARNNREAVIALSKEMYVLTPFTSLLVLENEDMYRQFKVDRGRKDHWALYPAPGKVKVVYEPEDGEAGDGSRPSRKAVRATLLVRSRPEVLQDADESPRKKRIEDANQLQFWMGFTRGGPDSAPELASQSLAFYGFVPDNSLPLAQLRVTRLDAENQGKPDTERAHPSASEGEELGVLATGKPLHTRGVAGLALSSDRSLPLSGSGTSLSSGLVQLPAGSSVNGSLLAELGDAIAKQERVLNRPVPPETLARFLNPSGDADSLLYRRPTYSGNERLFFDLLTHAPGLDTSPADVSAALEAEAAFTPSSREGLIDPGARKLLEKARAAGWRSLVFFSRKGGKELAVTFDGKGRFAWKRGGGDDLAEQVVCDGKVLYHLYPELGLGARRTVSRFHRRDLAALVPWFVPPAEDLARGADVLLKDDRTALVIPHDCKNIPHVRLELIFDPEGNLGERRLVLMPEKDVLLRQKLSQDGKITVLDGKGKELSSLTSKLSPTEAHTLKAEVKDLVLLDLPYRTPAQVRKSLGIEKKTLPELTCEEAKAVLAAEMATGNAGAALSTFQQALFARDERKIGYYVLLAAAGVNLDGDNADVLGQHPESALAQYLALHSSPALRKHASQWAAGGAVWPEGFVRRLALGHALCQRWQSGRGLGSTPAGRKAERERALGYVRKYPGTALAWGLLGLVQDRTLEQEGKADLAAEFRAACADLAGAWKLFEGDPALGGLARYERARCLFRSGKQAEARELFRAVYRESLAAGGLPRLEATFREALLGAPKEEQSWNELVRETARNLLKEKNRYAVLVLSRQSWQLDDQALSQSLLRLALEGAPSGKEGLALRLAALEVLSSTNQLTAAEQLLESLLQNPEVRTIPDLWRIGASLAGRRENGARRLECLERALELEFRDPPAVTNLGRVREDYRSLLGQYGRLADSLLTLKMPFPPGFRDRVVRAADRWRALDAEALEGKPDSAGPCELAAEVLRGLGERELSWDYLTTPVAGRPGEAGPLLTLARALGQKGEAPLADRAFAAAFDAEPTDAQVLWERAQNLRQAGQLAQARKLVRTLAEGSWQPRFAGLQAQARSLLAGE